MFEPNAFSQTGKEVVQTAINAKKSGWSKKIALTLIAALTVGLCFEETALARGGHGGGGGGGRGGSRGGNARAARSNRGGNARAARVSRGGGRHSRHLRNHRWSQSRYYSQYGCNLYYDADDQCWYYWCPPDNCYYPVDYCPYGTYSW
jgi:hypothetical protein